MLLHSCEKLETMERDLVKEWTEEEGEGEGERYLKQITQSFG